MVFLGGRGLVWDDAIGTEQAAGDKGVGYAR